MAAKKLDLTDEEIKLLKRALNKMDQSSSRVLTTAQKEENDKAIASAKEELAAIATLKTKLHFTAQTLYTKLTKEVTKRKPTNGC